MQTRRASLVEAAVNVSVGWLVAVAANLVVLPAFGLPVSAGQAAGIGAAFAGVSLVRSYGVRRLFNRSRGAAMASVNKVTILGNLGRDPETRTFQNGDKVCNLRVATSERWKDRATGEPRERTEWHSVAIFGPLADVASRYLRKGSKVYLEGRLETRKWQDQSGQDRYATEVVLRPFASQMVMLDGRSDGQGGQGGGYDQGGTGGPAGGQAGAPSRDIDDEIPF